MLEYSSYESSSSSVMLSVSAIFICQDIQSVFSSFIDLSDIAIDLVIFLGPNTIPDFLSVIFGPNKTSSNLSASSVKEKLKV